MDWLTTIFGTQHHLSVGQECARAVLVLAYGLLLVRVAGRRVFGKWSALDIVVSIIIGSNLSRALTGNAPFVGTLAATAALIALHWLLGLAVARWPRLSRLLEGHAIDLSKDGRVDRAALIRHSVSEADLNEALREKQIESVDDARKITLEPSGTLSVLKR